MSSKEAPAASLLENKHVKVFMSILQQQQQIPSMRDIVIVVNELNRVGGQLDAVVGELAAMRKELAEARDAAAHPARSAVITLESNVSRLRAKFADLREKLVEGCKRAVAAFKEKGVAALDSTARFFNLRPGLEAMQGTLDKVILRDDEAIAKIDNASTEYHKAGLHIKNAGRVLVGKEARSEVKAPGKLAQVVKSPYRGQRAALSSMRQGLAKALAGLERLEQAAERSRPSIADSLKKHSAEIEEAKIAAPAKTTRHAER